MRNAFRYGLVSAASVMLLATAVFAASATVPYKNDAKGFGLTVPENWEVKESEGRSVVTVTAPAEGAAPYAYRANVRVRMEELAQAKQPMDYAQSVFERLRKNPEFAIERTGRQVISHTNARWWIVTWREKKAPVKAMMYVVTRGNRAFTIIAASHAEQYRTYKETLGDISSSLSIY